MCSFYSLVFTGREHFYSGSYCRLVTSFGVNATLHAGAASPSYPGDWTLSYHGPLLPCHKSLLCVSGLPLSVPGSPGMPDFLPLLVFVLVMIIMLPTSRSTTDGGQAMWCATSIRCDKWALHGGHGARPVYHCYREPVLYSCNDGFYIKDTILVGF